MASYLLTYEATIDIGEAIDLMTDRSELSDVRNLCEVRILWLRGHADGKYAGQWVFDGNTPAETVLLTQAGIKNGDPAILDSLPQTRLGGEWADDPTWADILKDEVEWDIDDPNTDQRDDLHDAYCEGFSQGVEDEVMSYGQ